MDIMQKFTRAGFNKNYRIIGDRVTFKFEGEEYSLDISQTGFSKNELENGLKYKTIHEFNENEKGYKFAKSCEDIVDFCYERQRYVRHESGRCVIDDNEERQGLSFLTDKNSIVYYMLQGYGDQFVEISFDRRHPEYYKMDDAKFYSRGNEWMATKYLVGNILDLREPLTLIKIIDICDNYYHVNIVNEQNISRFCHFLERINACETMVVFNKFLQEMKENYYMSNLWNNREKEWYINIL